MPRRQPLAIFKMLPREMPPSSRFQSHELETHTSTIISPSRKTRWAHGAPAQGLAVTAYASHFPGKGIFTRRHRAFHDASFSAGSVIEREAPPAHIFIADKARLLALLVNTGRKSFCKMMPDIAPFQDDCFGYAHKFGAYTARRRRCSRCRRISLARRGDSMGRRYALTCR